MNKNKLTNEDWSSKKDQIFLSNANEYERKCYHNRYFLAFKKAIQPLVLNTIGVNVVDIATGSGAGAAYLYEQARRIFEVVRVIGVDKDENSIKYAEEHYDGSNLTFTCEDAIEYMEGIENVDAVVSMETIEHISYDYMKEFIRSVHKSLIDGGVAVFSSPRLRPRETTVKRDGHINELYFQQFLYELTEVFPFVEFYSFDRYGNIVPFYPDCNLMVGICHKWNQTKIF